MHVTGQLSQRGCAFEPVLEIEEFIVNVVVSVVAGVAVLLVLLLRVLLGPGQHDLRGVVDDDVATGANVE